MSTIWVGVGQNYKVYVRDSADFLESRPKLTEQL